MPPITTATPMAKAISALMGSPLKNQVMDLFQDTVELKVERRNPPWIRRLLPWASSFKRPC